MLWFIYRLDQQIASPNQVATITQGFGFNSSDPRGMRNGQVACCKPIKFEGSATEITTYGAPSRINQHTHTQLPICCYLPFLPSFLLWCGALSLLSLSLSLSLSLFLSLSLSCCSRIKRITTHVICLAHHWPKHVRFVACRLSQFRLASRARSSSSSRSIY